MRRNVQTDRGNLEAEENAKDIRIQPDRTVSAQTSPSHRANSATFTWCTEMHAGKKPRCGLQLETEGAFSLSLSISLEDTKHRVLLLAPLEQIALSIIQRGVQAAVVYPMYTRVRSSGKERTKRSPRAVRSLLRFSPTDPVYYFPEGYFKSASRAVSLNQPDRLAYS